MSLTLSVDYLGQVFQWSKENIDSQLPLQPNGIMCFTLCINGMSDFLCNNMEQETIDPEVRVHS